MVLSPPAIGPYLVQVKVMGAKRLITPEDAYCERREYWRVLGGVRTLLAADCADQWGPDSQAPIIMSTPREGQLKLSYVEWLYDRACERAEALVDLQTAKVLSYARWSGQAPPNSNDCRRGKALRPLPLGRGTADLPLLRFHADD